MASNPGERLVPPATFGEDLDPYELPPTSRKNESPRNRRTNWALGILAVLALVFLIAVLSNAAQDRGPLPPEPPPGQFIPSP